MYLLESPRRGDSNKYTKRMFYKKSVQKYPLPMLQMGPIKVLYNCKFDFTAKYLVTNTVVIMRILCNSGENSK